MDKPVLRSEDEVIWLVGRPISQLPANRIPTKGDVLRLFFYFKNGPMKKEKHVNFNGAIAEMVLAAVQEEWDKAGIIVQRKDKVKAKILDLYENYRLLQKGKGCKSNEEKEIKFIEQLKNYYRECAELMLILLGEEPPRGIHWLRPGAYHHARWMSTVLYSAKMYAFGEQLKYSQTKMEKLRRVCMFNALFYVKAWLTTTSAADAPLNDLQLWHDLNMYTKTDAGVAGAAITALDRHLWYLAEEIVPFALFSNLVSESEKRQIARQLLKVRGTEPLETGIPVFPQLNASTRLIHLIGKKSLLMFNLLNIESDWLSLPPAQWETVDDFQKAAMFVFHVKVVNDLSERAMKLITDFADTITKDEDQLQFMLQVVEAHRRKLPGFTKETLKKI